MNGSKITIAGVALLENPIAGVLIVKGYPKESVKILDHQRSTQHPDRTLVPAPLFGERTLFFTVEVNV